MNIKNDEFEFLIMLLGNEIKVNVSQLDWYEKYEPDKKDYIKTRKCYIIRLEDLRNKLRLNKDEVKEE